jgi:hypothetical protein
MNDHITRKKRKRKTISPFMHGSILRRRDKEIEKFTWFGGVRNIIFKVFIYRIQITLLKYNQAPKISNKKYKYKNTFMSISFV